MSMLGLEDLDDLHKHLDHCHSLPSLCEGAMTALRDKLRTESSICFVPTVRRGSMHATLMASFGIDKQQTQLYKDYYFQIDPFRPLFQALARSGKDAQSSIGATSCLTSALKRRSTIATFTGHKKYIMWLCFTLPTGSAFLAGLAFIVPKKHNRSAGKKSCSAVLPETSFQDTWRNWKQKDR